MSHLRILETISLLRRERLQQISYRRIFIIRLSQALLDEAIPFIGVAIEPRLPHVSITRHRHRRIHFEQRI